MTFLKQQRKISTEPESVESTMPMAVDGQLQWVKRSISSLSSLVPSEKDDDEDPPSLWWPSILFNDYDDFLDFFPEEFDKKSNDDEGDNNGKEAKRMIQTRVFQNMAQRGTIMVARLLGRPINEYVEIVESPVVGKSKEIKDYQVTKFVSFTRMPQEVYHTQINPEVFMAVSSKKSDDERKENVTTFIDDDLYMSYMLALDLAATKRIGGPNSPNDTLQSVFRDIGRAELEKLESSVQRLSKMVQTAAPTGNMLGDQEPNGEEKAEDDKGESESESESEDESEGEGESESSIGVESENQTDDVVEGNPTENSVQLEENARHEETEGVVNASQAQNEEIRTEAPVEDSGPSKETSGCEAAPSLTAMTDNDSGTKQDTGRSAEKPTTNVSFESPMRPRRGRRPKEVVASSSKKADGTDESAPTGTSAVATGDCVSPPLKKSKRGRRPKEFEDLGFTEPKKAEENVPQKRGPGRPKRKGKKTSPTKNAPSSTAKKTPTADPKKASASSTTTPNLKTPKGSRKRSNTVTPTPSTRPKRARRSPNSPTPSFKFKSKEQEEFYQFQSLMKQLVSIGWQYKPSSKVWQYVRPGCKRESQRGQHLLDFFYEESEVIEYCMNNNYYERREEFGLCESD